MVKNIAIIGCGRIGNRHAQHALHITNVKAVCDIVPERVNKMALTCGASAYCNIDELLYAEKNIDVVSICTPNGLHAQHAIAALEAGINVLCEKPLCLTIEEGEKMIAAAKKAGKQLYVVKQNRYNPPVIFLKQLIEQNKLGKIYSFQINCFWNRPAAYYSGWKGTKKMDGGSLFTQFSHFIDLLYWLLGDVASVKRMAGNFAHPAIEFEDTGIVLFNMHAGSIGTLNYTVNSFQKNMEGSFTIFGEKGTVKIGGQYLNELEYFNVEGIEKPNLPAGNIANDYGFYQGSMSNHDKVYENLLLALENPAHLFAGAADGLKTVEIIERIYAAKN